MKTGSLATIAILFLIAFATPPALLADEDAAIAMFKSRCSPCHAQDGSGNTPMGKKLGARALGSDEVQKQTDAALLKAISAGKGKMPSFTTKLTSTEVLEVVKYMRTFAKK